MTRAALSGLVLLIAFGFCEFFARSRSAWFASGFVPSQDERLGYELSPGYWMQSHAARINLEGMNDREFSPEKRPGAHRIAVVGDSTSFGYLIGREKSFPKILETMLRSAGHAGWEVLNFSVPGYNTFQERALIETKVMRFHPDIVILVYCGNDTFLPNYLRPNLGITNSWFHGSYFLHKLVSSLDRRIACHSSLPCTVSSPPWLLSGWTGFKSRILKMHYPSQAIFPTPGLEEVLYVGSNPPSADRDVPPELRHMTGWNNYELNLKAIRDLLDARGIVFVSTGLMDDRWLAVNRKLGIAFVLEGMKSASALRSEGRDPLDLYLPDLGHWNEKGHRAAARLVFEYLQAHRWISRAGARAWRAEHLVAVSTLARRP